MLRLVHSSEVTCSSVQHGSLFPASQATQFCHVRCGAASEALPHRVSSSWHLVAPSRKSYSPAQGSLPRSLYTGSDASVC